MLVFMLLNMVDNSKIASVVSRMMKFVGKSPRVDLVVTRIVRSFRSNGQLEIFDVEQRIVSQERSPRDPQIDLPDIRFDHFEGNIVVR